MNMEISYTKSEKQVLSALQKLTCATAEDIYFAINSGEKRKKIGLTSIYRALKGLEKACEIKPVNFNDGKIRYDLNSEKHHHHFICTKCHNVEIIDFCPYEFFKKELKEKYIVQYHNFELFGICKNCRD